MINAKKVKTPSILMAGLLALTLAACTEKQEVSAPEVAPATAPMAEVAASADEAAATDASAPVGEAAEANAAAQTDEATEAVAAAPLDEAAAIDDAATEVSDTAVAPEQQH